YIAKSIGTPLQIIGFRCSNHLQSHRHADCFTNICERMVRSQELSECKCGTVIGCHLCNKSIRDISWLLNIPQSPVNGIINKVEATGNNRNSATKW
ncbi:unnamed protein product, partial [Staurois parvus]